jgi:CheY-like chemotaxis protein
MNLHPVKVLVIDDNPEHIAFLERLLGLSPAGADFDLEAAESLADGFERLRHGDVGLILLDLGLGDSEGLETFMRVAAVAPTLRSSFSGRCRCGSSHRNRAARARDYLIKGFVDNQLLVRSMWYACERKRAQLELKRANDELKNASRSAPRCCSKPTRGCIRKSANAGERRRKPLE